MEKGMKQTFRNLGISAIVLTVLGACGPNPSTRPVSFPEPTAGAAGTWSHLGAASSSALNAILGTYAGTVVRSPGAQSQPYQLVLSTLPGGPTQGSSLVGNFQFSSNGALGNIQLSGELRVGINGILNGYDTDGSPIYLYELVSSIVEAPALSDSPFSLRFLVNLKNGTAFIASQSQLGLRECLFYPTSTACNTSSLTISFAELRKL
jgi:hypothetical protein